MSMLDELKAVKRIFKSVEGLPEAEVARVRALVKQEKPFFCRVTDAFNGTCRFYAFVFTVCGIILAFMGKLTAEYVALVSAIQALLVAHSMGQDYHARNCQPDPPDQPGGASATS